MPLSVLPSPLSVPAAARAVGRDAKLGRPVVVAIGGSDPSAGAGIQADLRSLEACGVVPATVVTAITVQGGGGVKRVSPVDAGLVLEQLTELRRTMAPAAVKTGVLPTLACVVALAGELEGWRVPIVIDPVGEAGAGGRLAAPAVVKAISRRLFPLAALLTVNLAEASALLGQRVDSPEAMKEAARELARLGPAAVLLKGGHLAGQPSDLLWDGQCISHYRGRRIEGMDMHGSGCALASAIAAGLAQGMPLKGALAMARRHVRRLIRGALPLDGGRGLRPPLGRRSY